MQPEMHRVCRRGVIVRAAAIVVTVSVALAIGRGGAARAEPRTDAGLVWQAPVSCPDAAEVRARIERRLGRPGERAVQGIEVDIAPAAGGGFVARIDLRAITVENQIRVLTSARCDELTDAVAVVIARLAAERRPVAEVARVPGVPGVHERPSPAVPPRTWGVGMRGMAVSGIGALPGIGLAGELAAYGWRRSLFVEVSATRWMPSSRFLAIGAPARVDIRLDFVAVRIGWRSMRLPLRGWLGGELGAVQGEGVSLDNARVGDGRWAAIDGGFGVAWPMARRARLVGIMELGVPVSRSQFLLQDGSLVYRPERVTVRSGLGLEVGW